MKIKLFTALVLLMAQVTSAQKISKDLIVGVWQSEEYKIEIFKSGDTYSAKLLWSKDMFEADGKTSKKDDKNPNIKLRSRPRQGITHITGLKFKDGEFVGGELYSANDGNTYGFKGKLTDVNSLETRGYKGLPIMGKTVNWTRVK
ncbi:DUF2147 domain-containing protein [Flavobacterium soli]|uniref:DUF2147 domain-containing protein n=1 Tax=Flavobacterium soli TaxID=344881 RepID=UPI000418E9B7|nr:DUF2147 domain-containing protein [Flavobacterium soli]